MVAKKGFIMKRAILSSVPLLLLGSACSGSATDAPSESLGQLSEALNGIVTQSTFLTKRQFVEENENNRRTNTDAYYANVGTSANGQGASISSALGDLNAFKTKYFAGQTETVAKYYNRGDLGLGREMHCVDRTALDQQVACYVTNFVAAPLAPNGEFSEFSFGMSSNIAFDNMLAAPPRPVATVAMVFRGQAPVGKDKVIFMVYNAAQTLTNTAPLDRHGLNYFNEFKVDSTPDASFGTPGVHFNNHIPSNCLNCHGGSYSPAASPRVSGAYFLPFDLDQFEYKNATGLRRTDLEDEFLSLNQVARRVAYRSTSNVENSIVKQIDGWYGNLVNPSETLPDLDFNSDYVPDGWDNSAADIAAYKGVVRPACRGCHMTSAFNFDSAASFQALALNGALDIKNHVMPHALQSQRVYWQSSQHLALLTYLTALGPSAGSALTELNAAGPGRTITLDPHLIAAIF